MPTYLRIVKALQDEISNLAGVDIVTLSIQWLTLIGLAGIENVGCESGSLGRGS